MIASLYKRSLTLVETLVAVVLVLAMGALVFPSLMATLEERAFEIAADETNEQLMLARAHAQATGHAVEVTYDTKTSQVQARVFGVPQDFELSASNNDRQAVTESWAQRDLARGVRIVAREPLAASSTNAEQSNAYPAQGPDDYESWDTFGTGQEIRLAVFMPDGTALVSERVWLNDTKGRVGVFTINPWSGLPFFERLADLSVKAIQEQSRK